MTDSAAAQILATLGPSCRDSRRRARLLEQGSLNGIDFVEYNTTDAGAHVLQVHFLREGTATAQLPTDPALFHVHGGTRITGIGIVDPPTDPTDPTDKRLVRVTVDAQGDFSPYLLTVGWTRDADGIWRFALPGIDRPFSVAPVNFRPGCAVDVDCAPTGDCPPEILAEPALDYLARDYASFRQMLIDLVAQRNPNWIERSPADLGTALLELFAYEGDQLSYLQDAVANEAFLDTARQRVSAKRHARLVDYAMHDGRNAWAYVHLTVSAAMTLDPGRQLVTRISEPLRRPVGGVRPTAPPGTVLDILSDEDYRTDLALAQVRVFETATTVNADPRNNELRIHTWGNDECCLPRGTTTAHLYAVQAGAAVVPPLKVGDHVLLEEMLGPQTGAAADRDPAHRQVVRIERVTGGVTDPLFLAHIDSATGDPAPAPPSAPAGLPLLEVRWRAADALTFPLCLSARLRDGTLVRRVSVARGNIVLADHGRTVTERYEFDPPPNGGSPVRLRLGQGPLTMQCEPPDAAGAFPPLPDRPDLTCDVRDARPAIALRTIRGLETARWTPVPDLLSSGEFDRHFTADVDNAGRAVLRFGDGEYGERFVGVHRADVRFRIGNGHEGNIGAEALSHVVGPAPKILRLRNPLPATAGVDPELIEQVRQLAPAAFRARQFRAVTEADYVDAALTAAGVSGAVAGFRWTGSWYTVLVAIDPTEPEHVVTDTRGRTSLAPLFRQFVHDHLTRYRLAGYDLEIRSARYVPLDLVIAVCAKRGYFPADVAHAVAEALGGRFERTGRAGFFDPSRLTFGQPVYLSQIYAAVENVTGVESATVTAFHRHGGLQRDELSTGILPIGAWEIARLDNDPSNPENGTLTVTAGGGS
jgi:hypothetical protein